MAEVTVRPLISESSTSESCNVEVVIGDLQAGTLQIPDYQRDCNQWGDDTKSLLIESVINNLTIPAFFFEVLSRDGMEYNEVVDGQQRLTTLRDFFEGRFSLVSADDAPYISPYSLHYAGKKFNELPIQYQQSFKKYRLTIIKLKSLGDMRLEIFRRINQGGTPLSGQDIRLAYYGESSKSVAFIRIAGIYDKTRPSAERFLTSAQTKYQISYPWVGDAHQHWSEWWADKEISHGQVPSEMFLWSLIAVDFEKLNQLLQDTATMSKIRCRYTNVIEEALDAYCSYCNYQDKDPNEPSFFMPFDEMQDRFFSCFMQGFDKIVIRGPGIPVTKHRAVASVIGNLYSRKVNLDNINDQQWTNIVEFVRRPQETAKRYELSYPYGKGRWEGNGGYFRQFTVVKEIVGKILS